MSADLQQGRLLAGDSRAYRLGDIIAEGGEGVVYRVRDRDDVVAKLYREWQQGRDDKLERLIARKNSRLTKIAAWPLSRLHDERDQVIGFVMERLEVGYTPLHQVYQIRSRLDFAPNRTYQFLVRVGRNLAACVHHVHEADIVIGDLNESNVLVGRDAMAKVIDVDSFQLVEEGTLFPCKVGKGELLPPELQGRSLENLCRTANHDRFSLAVLIFEVLVFGRHPFAGRPQVEQEVSLELAIKNGWYPYTKRREVPILPPPHLTLDFLPPRIRELFEDAFDPAVAERPSANEWFEALRSLEDELDNCPVNGGHAHWRGCPTCPWCELEAAWNVPLFLPSLPTTLVGSPVDVEALWDRVKRLPAPVEAKPPELVDYTQLPPARLPWALRLAVLPGLREFPWFLVVPLLVATRRAWTSFPLVAIGIGVLFAVIFGASLFFVAPVKRRVARATRRLTQLREEWDETADPALFVQAKSEIETIREKLMAPLERLQEAREARIRKVYHRQLHRYLAKYSILAADVTPPIASGKRDYLYDEGFKTAADIEDAVIDRRADKSESFWAGLREWRSRLEETFWATSNFSLSPADEREVMVQVQNEARDLRERLEQAEEKLLLLREDLTQNQLRISAEADQLRKAITTLGPRLVAMDRSGV
jgi:DNA-binding helix-hairpin-helix protein with protein kinase domain